MLHQVACFRLLLNEVGCQAGQHEVLAEILTKVYLLLYTAQYTVNTLHCVIRYTARSNNFVLELFPIKRKLYYLLSSAHCKQHTVHCTMYNVNYLDRVAPLVTDPSHAAC